MLSLRSTCGLKSTRHLISPQLLAPRYSISSVFNNGRFLSMAEQQRDHYEEELAMKQIENQKLQALVNEMSEQIDALTTERNKYRHENQVLSSKYTYLLSQQRARDDSVSFASKHHSEWHHDDIVSWICELDNGKYAKYAAALWATMREEEMRGDLLRTLDKNDLHRFGITKHGDKVELMRHIDRLLDQHRE
eukprot:CAMPEP_0197021130 /NCGR_PEP_ID=MMETSP1384-20130603/2030_1 /TAXON_ID=29189 /ORGANISM="Ammonia sp." /LENGTH=191 /DNA_ID=CAMNT_0042448893 /DNA_START=42 /DNA_END=617 /DNA_ORIENTATION=+